MLKVEIPGSRMAEREYVLTLILTEWLGLQWTSEVNVRSDTRITLLDDPGDGEVLVPDVLLAIPDGEWLASSSLPAPPLPLAPIPPARGISPDGPPGRMPVLFGSGDELRNGSSTSLMLDVFGGVFFLVTRYEELVLRVRDGHGRFGASHSIQTKEDALEIPLADLYVDYLWSVISRTWPRLERAVRTADVVLTHDADHLLAADDRSYRRMSRRLLGDLALRRDPGLATRRLRAHLLKRRAAQIDPFNSYDFLMDVSERHGYRSHFYFISADSDRPIDGFYSMSDPWLHALLEDIHRRGHQIGLHGSYDSPTDGDRLASEFDALRRGAESAGVTQTSWGGRQHFLRWSNPETWRIWDAAGLDYDSTIGYPERVGFRAGTCREFPVFDLLDRRQLRLRERPLIVMDGSLFGHMRLSSADARSKVRVLARWCWREEGSVVLLWHNSMVTSDGERRRYESIIEGLSA